MGNFIDLSKEIEVDEVFEEDFTQFPPNTRLYRVTIPEATNVKFYRNHQTPNKVKITFISINEEYKRKYNTIGLYFFDFEMKEGQGYAIKKVFFLQISFRINKILTETMSRLNPISYSKK